jgi:hypothetical protein
MKSSILILAAFFLFFQSGYSQNKKIKNKDIPSVLSESFNHIYPNVKTLTWEYDTLTECYKVFFINKINEREAYFRPDGRWVLTQTSVDKHSLPATIVKSFKDSKYNDWKIFEADRIETPEVKNACRLKIKNGKEIYLLAYDLDGNLLRAEKKM